MSEHMDIFQQYAWRNAISQSMGERPVIEYRERFVQINILHTEANGYRCRNEGCPCHEAEAERRAMEGDTGKLGRIEREQRSRFPWR